MRYLVRLDDACPTMNRKKWNKIEMILDKHNIKPMVGIIPHNKDISLQYDNFDSNFIETILSWKNKDWALALHGYNHLYSTNEGGINPVQKRSEFAGIELEKQKEKIKAGIKYFHDNNIDVHYFFAPSHTFDLNTIEALKDKSNIRIISDTMAFNPYIKYGMIFIPQQFGYFRNIIVPGTWTFCYHPNSMDDNAISQFESFIEKYKQRFISFKEIKIDKLKDITLQDLIYQKIYFFYRRLKHH